MKIPLIPLHIITTKTRNKIAKDAKTEQRTLNGASMRRLLRDNHDMAVIIQKATRIKKKKKVSNKNRKLSSR